VQFLGADFEKFARFHDTPAHRARSPKRSC
jgi:hypothetical protein